MTGPSLPTREDLARLPLRALVASAVRFARRVQPPYLPRADDPQEERHTRAIDNAIRVAEAFAGEPTRVASAADAATYAAAAADAATSAADATARAAAASAASAASAARAAAAA